MKKKMIIIITAVLLFAGPARGQALADSTPKVLKNLFGRLLTDFDDNDRLRINDSINYIIGHYAASDSVFTYRFTGLRYLGQITSPDSLIKMISWNLVLEKEPGKYFCYLIRKGLKGTGNKIYFLTGAYDDKPILTDTTYTMSDWYGALYYDIRPVKTGTDECWMLLGISFGNQFVTRKLIDVLSFSPDDRIVLGRKWFNTGSLIKYRDVFEYSSSGTMSLRFVSDSSIVFDHLVPVSASSENGRLDYGPGFSYDAYNFRNGMWNLSVNIDARNRE
jgi:hypothetical protein